MSAELIAEWLSPEGVSVKRIGGGEDSLTDNGLYSIQTPDAAAAQRVRKRIPLLIGNGADHVRAMQEEPVRVGDSFVDTYRVDTRI